ncbi:hypothetical protein I0C86_33855 [Plantactinospora sp. S1510]|uniref:Esterase-like activity of phytase family protein n=1 Tax=Plantactinospora alkalitolerans TaxID=2789879 RepID=A0ABS0H6V4_9ACTN|nr:hypothetical protein [Plantactinospora alkalitolerans]MBF9133884.1 hypothetical protein [Plantactinospora alkalitolerans]
MRSLSVPAVAAVLVLVASGTAAGASGTAAGAAVPGQVATSAAAGRVTRICEIGDKRLTEISGLVATANGYIVVNDGSNRESHRRIFFLNRACAVTRAVAYPSRPRDTEDLARAPDGTVWVADIGDNGQSRQSVALWKLAPNGRSPVLHRLSYPDGPHDAEAFLLSGDGTPIIVTKDPGTPGLYVPTGPLRAGATVPMAKVGEFTLPRSGTSNPFYSFGTRLVTGAALAPDGSRAVLRTYADAFEFDVTGGDVAGAITRGVPRITPLPDEPQGESITYGADGRSLLTVSEAVEDSSATRPAILSYRPPSGSGPAPSATSPAAVPAVPTPATSGAAGGELPRAGRGPDNAGYLIGAVVLALIATGVFVALRLRGLAFRRRGRSG